LKAEGVLIGLDIGTTGIKAIAFGLDGSEQAKAIRPTPTRHLPNGHAEHGADALWSTSAAALRDVAEQLDQAGLRPLAICCTSMAEAGVLVDGVGEPVHPVIPWFDFRTQPQIEWWSDNVGVESTAAVCGVVLHPMFGMPKLMWIRDNEPEAYAQGRTWLNLADFIDYRMCGVMATDYSLASRTLVLDLVHQCWSSSLMDAIGLDVKVLAELVAAGTRIGSMLTEPGVILDSIGTAEAFFAARSEPDLSGRFSPDELNQGVHVVPGFTYVMTGTGDGGGRIDAHRSELGMSFDDYLSAAQSPGPERSMIESLAVDGQALFERMAWASGAKSVRHLATGGGTRIPLLMERKRELGGRAIQIPLVDEATCWGAALLAGVGIEAYRGHATAAEEAAAWSGPSRAG